MNKQPKTRSEWNGLIEEYQKSHLTQPAFCKEKGLILHRFVYSIQRYRKQNKLSQPSPSFSPVVIKPSAHSSHSEIKIELPNGLRCQVPTTLSLDSIKELLGALLRC